jgi:hypothetical protein
VTFRTYPGDPFERILGLVTWQDERMMITNECNKRIER